MPEFDMKQVTEAVEGINRTFEEFKATNDARLAEIEKNGGEADVVTREKLDRIDDEIKRLDKIADEAVLAVKRSQRMRVDANGNEIDFDKKAHDWLEQARTYTKAAPTDFDATAMAEYKAAYQSFMRKNFDRDLLTDGERKTLSVGQDSAGGYFVYPDLTGQIVQQVYETTPIRAYASIQQISTDALEGYYDNDEVGYGWVSELESRPATTTPTIGKWRIPVHEIYAMPDASQSVLDDSMVNLETWLNGKISDKFARAENAASVTGDGVGKWRGFATLPNGTDLTNSVEQFATGASGAYATDPDGADKLIEMVYGLKSAYRANAVWGMNSTTAGATRILKDSYGQYLWQPSNIAGQPATFLGYPVAFFEDMADIAANSLSVVFGDFRRAYQIVDRVGIRMLRDPYTSKPKILFYATKRSGGAVINGEAIKLLKFGS